MQLEGPCGAHEALSEFHLDIDGASVEVRECKSGDKYFLVRDDEIIAWTGTASLPRHLAMTEHELAKSADPLENRNWVFDSRYEVAAAKLRGGSGSTRRLSVITQSRHWPNGVMQYTFDPAIDLATRGEFLHGMRTWTSHTRIRFEPQIGNERAVIYESDRGGCYSCELLLPLSRCGCGCG